MKKKLNLVINTSVLLLALFIAYKMVLPGREPINKNITDNFFTNSDINKLFKIKDEDEKKYFFIKNKKTVQLYDLNETETKIKKVLTIPFQEHWFSVKNRGMDTYLVLHSNGNKNELKLFDNDIRPLTKELE